MPGRPPPPPGWPGRPAPGPGRAPGGAHRGRPAYRRAATAAPLAGADDPAPAPRQAAPRQAAPDGAAPDGGAGLGDAPQAATGEADQPVPDGTGPAAYQAATDAPQAGADDPAPRQAARAEAGPDASGPADLVGAVPAGRAAPGRA